MIRRFLFDRSASTAIEYSLIAALVGMVLVAGLTGTTSSVGGAFEFVMEKVGEALGK